MRPRYDSEYSRLTNVYPTRAECNVLAGQGQVMPKRTHLSRGRRLRRLGSLGAAFLALSAVGLLTSVWQGGIADAATAPAVPVAGVAAFGIGSGQLSGPAGIALDAKGDLFVADQTNSRVYEYTATSATSFVPTGVTVGGAGGQGSGLSQLSYPTGVALDASGDLFVSDTLNNRVVEYAYSASTGSYASTGKVVAGTGTAGSGLSQLSYPGGIALDAKGDLFVADSSNNRVEEFAYNSATGSYAAAASTVAGTGTSGSGTNQLDGPSSVTLDAKGDLFIADEYNARVMEYPFSSATGSYAASGTEIGGGLPNLALWVTIDPSGDLFASYGYLGYNGVEEFTYSSATSSYASTGTVVGSGNMLGPTSLAFNSSGDLFATQTSQTSDPSQSVWYLVLEFTNTGGTFSPLGTIMSQVGRTNGGISSVALDSHGNLFVADGPIYEFPFSAAKGTYSVDATAIAGSGDAPALDSHNNLFVANADSPGVLEYPWNASAGSYPSSGSAVPGAAQLATLTVTAMAFDANNDLFVASGSQVLEFPYNATTGVYAASGTVIATVPAGSPTSLITGVGGIALDASGDLFVSNPAGSQVQEYLFNATTGAYASTGITVAGTGGMGAGTNQLDEPTGLAVDHSGDLYVFDASNDRIMEFTGNSATGAYGANGTAIFSALVDNYPQNGGVAVDSQGDVFFGNDLNSAVVYEVAAGTSTAPPSAPAVTGVSPSSGPAAGGTPVTVTGSNLSGGSVAFGATPATGVSCTATSCTATSPAGSGTVNVTVKTSGGTSTTSTANQFTYQATPPPVPAVTGVSPSSGPAAGGTAVTVTGSGLSGGSVSFGSAPASGVSCSATSCTAISPAGSGMVNVTVKTSGGTSATSAADQFTYQATPPPANLIPNPGFESAGVPADHWGSTLARSAAVVHSGAWALAETTSSGSGGWDLDSNPSWYAPISSGTSYTASIWVRATATVKVDLNVDLLKSGGNYVDSANGPTVTLTAGTWTQLTIKGIKPAAGEVDAGMEPNFSSATKGTIIYWDDMSLTSP